jgi:subtilisin family serine protease
MTHRSTLLLAFAVATSACASDATAPTGDRPQAALVASDGSISGHYIVVADWSVDAPALAAEYGLQPRHTYEHLLNGFAAAIPDDVVAALSGDPRVLRVSVQRQLQKLATTTEPAAAWGIDRIDQRTLPLDGTYSYDHDAHKVRAYIIDTGVRYSHTEFEGRATLGFDAFANDPADALLYDGSGDCDGHGTHVAGTVGGRTYGVAKRVQIVGVRVLNCAGYGSDADVIAGMDWVAEHGVLPASANMSLGDVVPSKKLGTSTEIDNAVKALVASGVSLAIAAGNGYGLGAAPGYDACDYPLANVPEAITVGATKIDDEQTAWTSFGRCVDVYAPGNGIVSSYATDDNATASLSGTSMATPHVAGVAALVLAQAPGATPAEVHSVIVNGATAGVVSKNPDNLTAALDPAPLLMLHSRIAVPGYLKGKHGSSRPCTPKRQRDGVC